VLFLIFRIAKYITFGFTQDKVKVKRLIMILKDDNDLTAFAKTVIQKPVTWNYTLFNEEDYSDYIITYFELIISGQLQHDADFYQPFIEREHLGILPLDSYLKLISYYNNNIYSNILIYTVYILVYIFYFLGSRTNVI